MSAVFVRVPARITSRPGRLARTQCDKPKPSIDPGISTSLKTISTPISGRIKTRIASSALAASITLYPHARKYSAITVLVRISSSTRRIVSWTADGGTFADSGGRVGLRPRRHVGSALIARRRHPILQNFANPVDDSIRCVGLWKQPLHAARKLRAIPEGGGRQYHRQAWMMRIDMARQGQTIQSAGHLDVADDEVDVGGRLQKIRRLVSADRLDDPESALTQLLANHQPHEHFVFHNQHGRRLPSRTGQVGSFHRRCTHESCFKPFNRPTQRSCNRSNPLAASPGEAAPGCDWPL